MDEDMATLDVNHTSDLVPLPSGKKAIGDKWVYKIKHKADGSIERYKVSLVAKVMRRLMALIMRRPLLP